MIDTSRSVTLAMSPWTYRPTALPAASRTGNQATPHDKMEWGGAVALETLPGATTPSTEKPAAAKVAPVPERAPTETLVRGAGPAIANGVAPGTLTMGLESPRFSNGAGAVLEQRYMSLLLQAHNGRAVSEQEMAGLTDAQKLGIGQAQVSALANQMGRILDLQKTMAFPRGW